MKTRIPFVSLVAAAFCCSQTATNAAAFVSFSGGGGLPMTMTLSEQISYTITNAANANPYFVFDGVGTLYTSVSQPEVTGTITFTINGGAPISVAAFGNNASAGAITRDDFYIFPASSRGLSVGDTVVLNPGTLTTAVSITETINTSGTYSSFLVNNSVAMISTMGTSVPEPSSAVLLTGLAALSLSFRSRRAHHAA